MDEVLSTIDSHLTELGLNYEFGRMTKVPVTYPYWVGDYTSSQGTTEDGQENISVILTGFSRGSFFELEKQKSIIINHYRHSVSVLTEKGSAMVIFYDNSFNNKGRSSGVVFSAITSRTFCIRISRSALICAHASISSSRYFALSAGISFL